jgi:hypothetical protein
MIVEFLPEAKAELLDAVASTTANWPDWANVSGMRSIGTSLGSQKTPKCLGSATEAIAA